MKTALDLLKIIYFTALFLVSSFANAQTADTIWYQSYNTISGAASEYEGRNVTSSSDGNIIAVAATTASDNGTSSGRVRVFSKANTGLVSLGEFYGNELEQLGQWDIAMNDEGTRIIASGPGTNVLAGLVKVFDFVDADSTWIQVGSTILGSTSSDQLGYTVSISTKGDTIAIGVPGVDQVGSSSNEGLVKTYYYDSNSAVWIPLAADIIGSDFQIYSGWGLSISGNGKRLAVGAPFANNDTGYVTVYELQENSWVQLGSILAGDAADDHFGGSMDFTPDGTKLIIGTRGLFFQNSTTVRGLVKVFEYQDADWVQIGSTLSSTVSGDIFGYDTKISADGSTIAVGLPGTLTKTGAVSTYQYDIDASDWVMLAQQLGSNAPFDGFGSTIDLSADGKKLIVGAPGLGSSDVTTGKALTYNLIDTLRGPEILAPENGTTVELPVGLSWFEEYPSSIRTDVQVSRNPDFSDDFYLEEDLEFRFDNYNRTRTLFDTLNIGETYYWRVKNTATEYPDFPATWSTSSFTVGPIDLPEVLTSNDLTFEPPFNLSWKPEAEPDYYHYNIQFSSFEDFSDTVLLETAYTIDSLHIGQSSTLPQGTYHWRIRRQAISDAELTSDWVTQTFTLQVANTDHIAPANGNARELPLNFSWNSTIKDSVNYRYQLHLSTQETFSDTIAFLGNLEDTTTLLGIEHPFEVGTVYWRTRRVAVENEEYASEWTSSSFELFVNAPELVSPINGDSIEFPSKIFWLKDTLNDYYDYRYEFHLDSTYSLAFNSGVTTADSSLTISQFILNERVTNSIYYRIQRFAKFDTMEIASIWSESSFFIDINEPLIQSPVMSDTINPYNAILSWSLPEGEESERYYYYIEVASDDDFSNVILNDTRSGEERSITLRSQYQQLDSGKYYWRVRRVIETFSSEFVSDSLTFQLPPPTPISPVQNGIISGELVEFLWNSNIIELNGSIGSADFETTVQVSRKRDFSQLEYEATIDNSLLPASFPQVRLKTNETYYWRIKETWEQNDANNFNNITSKWSEVASFYIEPDYIRLLADSVFSADPSYVNVMLHALDDANKGITTLEREDFELLENDAPISPTESRYQVSKLETIPSTLQTILMLDNSLSIGEDNLGLIKNAAKQFIRGKADNQSIALYVFADQVELILDYSSDTTALLGAIDDIALTRFSGTDLFSATITGLDNMEEKFTLTDIQQSFMLLFTDGKDLAGRATLDSVLNVRGNKQIFAVGVKLDENDFDETTLRQIGNAGTFIEQDFEQLTNRFSDVQEDLIRFSNAFYWLNYSSTRRAGDTELTVRMTENTNPNADAEIVTSFDADGFYSSPIDIVINGSAELPLGIDTLRMAADDTIRVKIETVFGYQPYPFSFEVSIDERLSIVSTKEAFNYDLLANGMEGDTIEILIRDTVQTSLALENTLMLIYGERTTPFNAPPNIEDQTFTINENSPDGTVIGIIEASDVEGDALTFAILSDNHSLTFELDPLSGELTVADSTALDYETNPEINLEIGVSDAFSTSTAIITVTLLDVDEGNDPPIVENQTFMVDEHAPNGTLIGTILGSDPDGDPLFYQITAGNEAGTFLLTADSGDLFVLDSTLLDFETMPQFALQVDVTDSVNTVTVEILIQLNDVIESGNGAPVIADQEFNLDENSRNGTFIGDIVATDPENDTLTYEILSGNDANTFQLVDTTGSLYVLDSTLLDFETNPVFTLEIQVTDSANSASAMVTIRLNNVDETGNDSPVIEDQSFSVDENSITGTSVGTVMASDPDGDALTFSILSGNDAGGFEIDENTGELTVALSAVLDYETNPDFSLTVEVSDGLVSNAAIVTITLNDLNENSAPVVENQTFTVDENSAVGTVVGIVVASDPENDPLTFVLSGGNENAAFGLDTLSGELTVVTSEVLDFETSPSFTFEIQVSDAELTTTASITVNLNDLNENSAPLIEDQSFTINENSAVGTFVGIVQATDPESDAIFYSILGGNGDGAFDLDTNTGVLTVADSNPLDFETTPTFSLTVEATDGDLASQAIITVELGDVDENTAPEIADQVFTIDENTENGTLVGSIVASDPDGDALSYSITNGNSLNGFVINSVSGELAVNDQLALDFETNPSFVLTISVSDGELASEAEVTITLNDVDETVTSLDAELTISVYPNPARKQFFIDSRNLADIIGIKLTTLSGKVMKEVELDTAQIDIEGFKSGVYLIIIELETGSIQKKLIVE